MTFAWPPDIVTAFEEARTSEAPLSDRLRIIANVVAGQFPEFNETVEEFVGRLERARASGAAGKERARAGTAAPAIVERLPSFLLPDQDGHLVSLESLLGDGPLVVAFVRGHWCP